MTQEITMYTIKCDNCGELFEDKHDGFCAWVDINSAKFLANDSDWTQEGNKDYCPNCYEYDDNDNLVLKQKTIKNEQ